tara:strand:- start:430 stop:798 length:369 start_codon:yes stop_codon:yes gene_type:complete
MSLKTSKNQQNEFLRKSILNSAWNSYFNSTKLLNSRYLQLLNNNSLTVDNYIQLINDADRLFKSGFKYKNNNNRPYRVWLHDMKFFKNIIRKMDRDKPIDSKIAIKIKNVIFKMTLTALKHR